MGVVGDTRDLGVVGGVCPRRSCAVPVEKVCVEGGFMVQCELECEVFYVSIKCGSVKRFHVSVILT